MTDDNSPLKTCKKNLSAKNGVPGATPLKNHDKTVTLHKEENEPKLEPCDIKPLAAITPLTRNDSNQLKKNENPLIHILGEKGQRTIQENQNDNDNYNSREKPATNSCTRTENLVETSCTPSCTSTFNLSPITERPEMQQEIDPFGDIFSSWRNSQVKTMENNSATDP